ncbi:hypothetical protein A0J61_11894, partial [Choanephora cucurbitarum]
MLELIPVSGPPSSTQSPQGVAMYAGIDTRHGKKQ